MCWLSHRAGSDYCRRNKIECAVCWMVIAEKVTVLLLSALHLVVLKWLWRRSEHLVQHPACFPEVKSCRKPHPHVLRLCLMPQRLWGRAVAAAQTCSTVQTRQSWNSKQGVLAELLLNELNIGSRHVRCLLKPCKVTAGCLLFRLG